MCPEQTAWLGRERKSPRQNQKRHVDGLVLPGTSLMAASKTKKGFQGKTRSTGGGGGRDETTGGEGWEDDAGERAFAFPLFFVTRLNTGVISCGIWILDLLAKEVL